MDHANREPVSTYEQALLRLVEHFAAFGPQISRDEPLPFVAQFVADMFWVSPSVVCRDLMKLQREVHHSVPRVHSYWGRA